MNVLKATEACFPRTIFFSINHSKILRSRSRTIHFCTNGSEFDSPSSSDEDKRRQEILARMAMIEAKKARIEEFYKEQSTYLTRFAEETDAEFNQIVDGALKELEKYNASVIENIERDMQASEETALIRRQEFEKKEKELEEFVDKIERDRNEALFFKNLTYKEKGIDKRKARVEAQKVMDVAKRNAGSKLRRNIYIALMALLGIAMANVVISFPEVEWQRVAAFALIFLAVLTQYVYELKLSSEVTRKEDENK